MKMTRMIMDNDEVDYADGCSIYDESALVM